jgi:hypothetical protein
MYPEEYVWISKDLFQVYFDYFMYSVNGFWNTSRALKERTAEWMVEWMVERAA